MADSLLLLVDGVSDLLLTNGVDFLLLEQQDAPGAASQQYVAFATPQHDGQTVTHMVGY